MPTLAPPKPAAVAKAETPHLMPLDLDNVVITDCHFLDPSDLPGNAVVPLGFVDRWLRRVPQLKHGLSDRRRAETFNASGNITLGVLYDYALSVANEAREYLELPAMPYLIPGVRGEAARCTVSATVRYGSSFGTNIVTSGDGVTVDYHRIAGGRMFGWFLAAYDNNRMPELVSG